MTEPAAVPRLKIIAYEYEVRPGDLLIGATDDERRRVAKVQASDDGATITFDDGTSQQYSRATILDIYRDQSWFGPPFQDDQPSIVA